MSVVGGTQWRPSWGCHASPCCTSPPKKRATLGLRLDLRCSSVCVCCVLLLSFWLFVTLSSPRGRLQWNNQYNVAIELIFSFYSVLLFVVSVFSFHLHLPLPPASSIPRTIRYRAARLEHLVRFLITQPLLAERPDAPALARQKTKRHDGIIHCEFSATTPTRRNYGSICRPGSRRGCW